MNVRRLATTAGATVTAALLLAPRPAAAWKIELPISPGCHERISAEALEETGYASEPPALGDDDALAASVDFGLDAYAPNIYAWSLILGTRYPDTHGAPVTDLLEIATIQNDDGLQVEHCLRRAGQDGPEGDIVALAECRAYVAALYWEALGFADPDGAPDPDLRAPLAVSTLYAGTVDWPVSGYYSAAGRALHAIQDSFTHTYRTRDWTRVVHVFNWIDQVTCDLDEARDGHGHESALDDCESHESPTSSGRYEAAVRASADFLAALRARGDRDAQAVALAAFFARWMTHVEETCGVADGYCGNEVDAWLRASGTSDNPMCGGGALGCSVTPAPARREVAASAVVLLLALLPLGVALRPLRRDPACARSATGERDGATRPIP
jgi:hypothetical protein